MRSWVFIVLLVSCMIFANVSISTNSYVLSDFVIKALSSSMVFDGTKSFSIGVGYKQFGSENYILGGFRFTNFYTLNAKFAGYLNVIVPVRYLYEEDFFNRWWSKIWLDAWLYFSF